MNEDLLKEYVGETLKELTLSLDKEKKTQPKKKGVWSKFKSLFSGNAEADSIADEWIEDEELYLDIEMPSSLKDNVRDFVRKKYPSVANRLSKKPEKMEKVFRKALDAKFGRLLRDVAAEQERRMMSDADEEE